MWQYEFPENYSLMDIEMTPDGRWIVVGLASRDEKILPRGYVYLFKKNGQLEWKYTSEKYVVWNVDIAACGEDGPVKGGIRVSAMADNGVIIFDRKGRVWKNIEYFTDLYDMSGNGNYFLMSSDDVFKSVAYDINGNLLWSKGFDNPIGNPAIFSEPLPVGYPLIVGDVKKNNDDNLLFVLLGDIHFSPGNKVYNKNGDILWDGGKQWLIRSVSRDGETFVLSKSTDFIHEDIRVIDWKTKNILWEKKGTEINYGIFVSGNGETILLPDVTGIGNSYYRFYTRKGKLIWEKEMDGYGPALTGNGKYFIEEMPYGISFYDIEEGKKLWDLKVEIKAPDVKVTRDGKYIAVYIKDGKFYFIKNTGINNCDDKENEE